MSSSDEANIQREKVWRYFDQYWKHNSVLRNWFVAYGIGALTLLLYNNGTFFNDTSLKKIFAILIVIGISLQVLLTFLNKIIHWFVYYGENLLEFQKTKCFKNCEAISKYFLIDIIIDTITILLYAGAFIIFIMNL